MKKFLLFLTTIISLYSSELETAIKIPDSFYNIKDLETQKEEFVNLILPIIKSQNQKILQERSFVLNYFSKNFLLKSGVEKENLKYIAELAKKYNIKNIYNRDEFLLKIDTIPISLALSQAVLESGWGKGKMARYSNNLFGYQAYSVGDIFKFRVFNSLQEAVELYMLNLNKHFAYTDFRKKRAEIRSNNKLFDGFSAAENMKLYSELGFEYNKMLRQIIETNDFHKLEQKRVDNIRKEMAFNYISIINFIN